MRRSITVAALAVLIASPALAQFSSDIPGVPRASIPFRGNHQTRWAWDLTHYQVGPDSDSDTTAFGLGLSYGRSYRVMSQFEIGFDFTLLEGLYAAPPKGSGTILGGAADDSKYMRGTAFYGFRVGGKWRPLSSLDPDGYGWEVAVGGALQPAVKPLFGVISENDSVTTGGQFKKDDENAAPTFTGADPFSKIHMSTQVAAMGSYRSKKITADAALVVETASEDPETAGSPLVHYDGLSPRIGATYRLKPGLSIGGAYWGKKGSPPWRDRILSHVPGVPKAEQYAFMLSFGSQPEAGTDIMVSSPTGNFSKSQSIYIRFRNTR